VEGNLEIVSGTGRRIEQTTRAFLCRCGQSQSKPFCDGSHKRVGFVA
jgi:CDGSH-type Zn-finger protein